MPFHNYIFPWYKTPSRVSLTTTANLLHEREEQLQTVASPRASIDMPGDQGGIPPQLALERILAGKTCSPMSLHDFHMYVAHIEHSSENLEFYTWFKDYDRRWNANPPQDEYVPSNVDSSRLNEHSTGALDFLDTEVQDNISEEAETKTGDMEAQMARLDQAKARILMNLIPISSCTAGACAAQPSKVKALTTALISKVRKPFTTQNVNSEDTLLSERKRGGTSSTNTSDSGDYGLAMQYRDELDLAIELFLLPDAAKELNVSSGLRTAALEMTATSTNPANLRPIAAHCYVMLKSCSHRNFVRLGVGNGTFETLCIATSLGYVLSVAGFVYESVMAWCHPMGDIMVTSRYWALMGFPFFWLGTAFILCGSRGSCFFLLLFRRRQLLPWERIDDDAPTERPENFLIKFMKRMMIFEKKVKVQDEFLRELQKRIVWESIIYGAIMAVAVTAFWFFLPIWKPDGILRGFH